MILLVIGNGVDIALGYPTTLNDCNRYLKVEIRDSSLVKNKLDDVLFHYKHSELFCGEFWKDVEENIPKVSKPPKDVSGRDWYGTDLWLNIHDLFQYWVVSICRYIKTHSVKPRNEKEYLILKSLIKQSDLIFNFNYTKTLEDHFNVDSNKIIHIHRDSEYPILGYSGKEKVNRGGSGSEWYKYYCTFFNGTIKNVISQFYNYRKRFADTHIDKMIFFRVSYSKVDWPYFYYIKKVHGAIQPDCRCVLYYHSLRDVPSAECFQNYLCKTGIVRNFNSVRLLPDH